MSPAPPNFKAPGFNISRVIRIVTIIVPLALAGNIIYALLATNSLAVQGFGNCNFVYLALATTLVFVPWIGHALRILIWGRVFGKNLTFGESFRTAVATDLGAAITPSAIGGSYAKLGILATFGFSPGEATLVTLLGTFEDAAFFIVSLPIAFVMTGAWNDPGIKQVAANIASYWPVFVGAGAVIIIGYILFIRARSKRRPPITDVTADKSNGFIHSLSARFRTFRGQFTGAWEFVRRNHKASFLLCSLLAGIGWTCRYSVITLLILGLGYYADPILFFLLQWVVFTLMTLFPTPGAIGGAEVSLALIFRGFVPAGVIPLLTGAWRFLTFYLIMIVGAAIIALFGVGHSRPRIAHLEEDVAEELKAV